MILIVAPDRQPAVAVQDATDLKRLSARVPGDVTAAALAAALAGFAGVDADGAHLHVDVAALKAAAARTSEAGADAGWSQSFDGMIAYARGKGWVDAQNRVRVHIERG